MARFRKLALFVLVLVLTAWATGAVWADEGALKDAAPPHEKPGIFSPQRWDLGIWTIVVFALLFLVLRRFAWGPILEGLKSREANIKGALAQAELARKEAQLMRLELQKEMSGAQDKIRQLMDEARRDAQRAKDEMITEARKEIQSERERLQREIALARDQALQELWTQTAQLATLVSAKAIRRQLNIEDHRRLVDEAIAELRTVGKDGRLS